MKIYKDFITGDEMFADIYKIKLVNEVIYEVYGKRISSVSYKISAKEIDELNALNKHETDVDVVLNHHLVKCSAFDDKDSYTIYLKDYMNKVLAKLEENAPDQVDVFKTNMNKAMEDILGRFKQLQFFTGESINCSGLVAPMEYRVIEGQRVPVLMFFKHGLEEHNF